ncbi:MAG: hypothetical protein GKS00_01520 [Alphaproteobacteria bacterium]|nr:hypothetical protein [Alphaproteobacteria bacterium]
MTTSSIFVLPLRIISAVALAAIFFLTPEAVRAAPQALGLVATGEAMPLKCDGDSCVVFLSSFCLEEERNPPSSRTAYTPAQDSEITLVVETRDGRTLRLPGRDYFSFRTRLDFTSILARVPMTRLADLSPVRVGIHVGTLASLVPVPVPGDVELHSPDELAVATGAYRKVGQGFFDKAGAKAETVAMVTRMINGLPQQGRLAKSDRELAYSSTVGSAVGKTARAGARSRFSRIVQSCEMILESTAERYNMRDCLQYRHEVIQTETNRAFWKALGGV